MPAIVVSQRRNSDELRPASLLMTRVARERAAVIAELQNQIALSVRRSAGKAAMY